jgi:hypothetical protein
MWKADFDTVYEAVSDGFEEDERFVVLWVEDDLLEFALKRDLVCATDMLVKCNCTWRALMSSIFGVP